MKSPATLLLRKLPHLSALGISLVTLASADAQTFQDSGGVYHYNDNIFQSGETWTYLGQNALGTNTDGLKTGTVYNPTTGEAYNYTITTTITGASTYIPDASGGISTPGVPQNTFYDLSTTLTWDKPIPIDSFRSYLISGVAGNNTGIYSGGAPQFQALFIGNADWADTQLKYWDLVTLGSFPSSGTITGSQLDYAFVPDGSGDLNKQDSIFLRGINGDTFTGLSTNITGVSTQDSIDIRLFTTFSATQVPEPSTTLLGSVALGGLLLRRRRSISEPVKKP